ncbi:MAG: CDP-archaeol synthase [bacterium]|nr:CDP-archaeol synthase [bacterium]
MLEISFFSMIFWTFLPAGVANMAPVFVKKVQFLNSPIDFNLTFGGKRIFGDNKTWRGLIVGIMLAIVAVILQNVIYPPAFPTPNAIVWGFLLGGGALIGDLIKSFFKRRLNIAPGHILPVADQIDWIIGALVFTSFVHGWSWQVWVCAIVVFGVLHPLVNLAGYWMNIKENKF